jgi:hypothetical protein
MSQTLQDAFVIPEDAGALGFVVQISGDAKPPAELIGDYVLTPGVRDMLPGLFDRMHHLFDLRSGEAGWFVHGSFGSGKSHFMALLSYLMENLELAWAKDDPLIGDLAARHRGWIATRRPLVVRENLLSASTEGSRFDRLLYGAVNKALAAAGKPRFEFLNLDGVLDEARREGQQYGDAFWRNLDAAGIVGGPADFEEAAAGGAEQREILARAYLEYKGRDPATAGFSPAWAEGLRHLATHVRAQGYGGIVFFIDEMLLWLSGLDGPAYKEAVNQLNVIVDHSDGPRDLPVAVFVARQRRFSEFFPDMVDEEQLHDHLDHHSGRFEVITLEDVELRYICRQRILRRSDPAAVEAAVDRQAKEQGKLLPALLQNADEHYLRDVYPFHPALIETLIDISSLLQRDRTALRLLYELLRAHRSLPLGAFIPVGNAFDAVFPGADFTASRKVEHLRNIQRIYQHRIGPALDQMARDLAADGFDAGRRHALDQLIKTTLLAEASPRLRGPARITVDRLVGLNNFDVVGETARGRLATAARDLAELSRRVPAVQVSSSPGSPGNTEIGVSLEGADFGEILERAKGQVDNVARRFRTFYDLLRPLLGLENRPGFGPHDGNDGPLDITWRGTRRRGTVCIGNVRELAYERFRVREGEFRIVVDYPWDEPGHQVEEDRQRALAFRKAEGSAYTVVWLPRHLSERETQTLVDLAAAEFIGSTEGRDKLLGTLPAAERQRVIDQAAERARSLRAEMERIVRNAYKDHGEALALTSDIPGHVPQPELRDNLDHFARELLDRRYPQHPRFLADPRPQELRVLLEWMSEASETADKRAPFDDTSLPVLRDLAVPLELADVGQRQARLRLDTRYIRDVLDRFAAETVLWAPVDSHLADTYGLPPAVRNLFLLFVMRALSFRALREQSGQPAEDLGLDSRPHVGLRLERARVLDLAAWSRARELGPSLFRLPDTQAQPTLSAQDAWAAQLRQAGHQRRGELRQLQETLAPLVPGDAERLEEVRAAEQRLTALDDPRLDSYQTLDKLISHWPADQGDPLREVVRAAETTLAAVRAIDPSARNHLEAARSNAALGPLAIDLLDDLMRRLADNHLRTPLAVADIRQWNSAAHDLVRRVLDQSQPPPTPPELPLVPPGMSLVPPELPLTSPEPLPTSATPGTTSHPVWSRRAIRAADPSSLDQDLAELGRQIADLSHDADHVEVDVTVHVTRKDVVDVNRKDAVHVTRKDAG